MWAIIPLLLASSTSALATFPSNDLDICIEAESGNPIPCLIDEVTEVPGGWDCDIRSWTRAPDLIPGHSIPAETRISMNGTQCSDVVAWEVGLRMLERAIIKIRNHEVDFPQKPQRKPYNATAEHLDMFQSVDGPDWNDIYSVRDGGWIMNRDDSEYEAEFEIYSLAMRNKSLFNVDGQERVIFDQKLALDLHSSETTKEGPINHIRGFSIDVPLTNFPPVKTYEGTMGSGKDEQMLNTESMFEYYHLLTLRNGSTLNIPAGRSGFLTEPRPVSSNSSTVQEMEWPAIVRLHSPRAEDDSKKKEKDVLDHLMGRDDYNKGPECDKGNKADFELTISSNTKTFSPDQNVTLSFHLSRTGNGTEYPAYLDISLSTFENVTFAYSHPEISSLEAYHLLFREDNDGRFPHNDLSWPQKMLLVQTQESLERRKKDSESGHGMIMMGQGNRWPVSRGTVRYDFEEVYGVIGDKEEYDFDIEFPIPYNVFPNFEKVFSTLSPQLSLHLQTAFLCAKPADPTSADNEEKSEDDKLDNEWEEWSLPTKPRTSFSGHPSRYLRHTGALPLQIHRPSNLKPEQQLQMTHYLTAGAKAPRLSSTIIAKITPLDSFEGMEEVNQVNRKEEQSELKQSRYDLYSRERQYQPRCDRGRGYGGCWNKNNGGGGMHAAKLWQRMEEEGKVDGHNVEVGVEQVVLGNIN